MSRSQQVEPVMTEKLDKETETMKPVVKQAVTTMSWKEYKNTKQN